MQRHRRVDVHRCPASRIRITGIKVEHIQREKRAERDQGSAIHLFIAAGEEGAKIYYKERLISIDQFQEHLQDMDNPSELDLELHVVKDTPERAVGRLIGIARQRGIERIIVTTWNRR